MSSLTFWGRCAYRSYAYQLQGIGLICHARYNPFFATTATILQTYTTICGEVSRADYALHAHLRILQDLQAVVFLQNSIADEQIEPLSTVPTVQAEHWQSRGKFLMILDLLAQPWHYFLKIGYKLQGIAGTCYLS